MASKKFSDLTAGQQAVIVMSLPALAAALLFYDFVMPFHQRVSVLHAQLRSLQLQNLRGKQLEAHRADLLKRIAGAQKKLQELRQLVPDEAANDQFVKMVYGDAVSAGVHVRSLVAGKSQQKVYFSSMPFQLHADGTYYRMLNFFTNLANSPRIVDVSGLSLGSPQGGGGSGSYKIGPEETVAADCLLTTYFKSSQSATVSKPKSGRPR